MCVASQEAMNEINAARRMRIAAVEKAEAEKVLLPPPQRMTCSA